jgi:hypothetical protein
VALQHAQKICYNKVNGGDEATMSMLLPGLIGSASQWLKSR